MAFVTPVIEHWLEQEIAQCVHHEESIQQPIASWTDALPWSYILLHNYTKVTENVSFYQNPFHDHIL